MSTTPLTKKETSSSSSSEGSGPSQPSGGSGNGYQGRGGRIGRGGGWGGHRNNKHNQKTQVVTNFKGNTKKMNGHVFQCFNECEDKKQFANTVEALGVYVANQLKYPGDMTPLFKDLTQPTIKEPEDLPLEEKGRIKVALWEKKVVAYCTRLDYIKSNLKTIFAVVWGQCSEAMKAKLTLLDKYDTKSRESNCVWILKEIKGITYHFDGQRYIFLSLNDARTNYYVYKQSQDDSLSSYLEHFRSLVEVLKHYRGAIGEDKALLDAVKGPINDPKQTPEQLSKTARDRTLTLAFLKRADRHRFKNVVDGP